MYYSKQLLQVVYSFIIHISTQPHTSHPAPFYAPPTRPRGAGGARAHRRGREAHRRDHHLRPRRQERRAAAREWHQQRECWQRRFCMILERTRWPPGRRCPDDRLRGSTGRDRHLRAHLRHRPLHHQPAPRPLDLPEEQGRLGLAERGHQVLHRRRGRGLDRAEAAGAVLGLRV